MIVYTVVASMLWPVKSADNTRNLAAGVASGYQEAFQRLAYPRVHREKNTDDFLAELLASGEAFQAQLASVKNHADGVTDYRAEWNSVASTYEELQAILLPALKRHSGQTLDYRHYIANYDSMLDEVEDLFRAVEAAWQGQVTTRREQALGAVLDTERLKIIVSDAFPPLF